MRTSWIDVAKGLGMFLVVLGHILKEEFAIDLIYSFHMPLFFFLSGYLLYNKISKPSCDISKYKKFGTIFKKKTYSLLLPFIVLRIFLFLYWVVVERHFRPLDLGPIWFLVVMYFVEIVYIPLILLRNKQIYSFLLIACSLGLFYLQRGIASNLEHSLLTEILGWSTRIVNSGIWFVLGFEFLRMVKKITKRRICCQSKHLIVIATFISCIIISILGTSLNGSVSIFSNRINNPLLYICTGLAGIIVVLLISKYLIKSNHTIEWIGYNSIMVLAFHEPIKRICLKTLDIYGLQSATIHNSLIYSILLSVGGVIIFTALLNILLKWIKSHIGKSGQYILCFVK